jgi:hypothetical protein
MRVSGELALPFTVMPPQFAALAGGRVKRICAVGVPVAMSVPPFATLMLAPEFR